MSQHTGEEISVGPEERAWFKKRRLALKLDQTQLALKVGWTQSSVSNLERGVHTQIKKQIYFRLVQVLGPYKTTATKEALERELAVELNGLNESGLELLRNLARELKRTHGAAPSPEVADDAPRMDRDRKGTGRGSR